MTVNRVAHMERQAGAEKMDQLRAAHSGDERAMVRAWDAYRRKQRKVAEQQRRAAARAGNVLLYRGPAMLGERLDAAFAGAREVTAKMSGHRLLRATVTASIDMPDGTVTRRANVVLLSRVGLNIGYPLLMEIIDTGSDIRVHIQRLRELRGGGTAPMIDLYREREPGGPIMPPLMPGTGWPDNYLDPAYADQIMRESLLLD